MRLISGVILGILLTIGVAYVVDAVRSAPGPDGKDARRMVNWDVVAADMGDLSSGVQALWARVVGDAKKLDRQVEKQTSG